MEKSKWDFKGVVKEILESNDRLFNDACFDSFDQSNVECADMIDQESEVADKKKIRVCSFFDGH